MLKDSCAPCGRPLQIAMAISLLVCAWPFAAWADDLKTLGNIGDAHKAVGLIARYDIHADTRTFDMIARTANGISENVQRGVAAQTTHEICAQGRVSGWTARMFMPGQSTPVATCRFGARR